MLKQFFSTILCFMFCFSTPVFAEEDVLDVFEEYAIVGETLVCENFSITTKKNTAATDRLRFAADEPVSFIIETSPEKGSVEITNAEGGFVYTPFTDETGTDSFTFRISNGSIESNIARCDITITEDTPPSPTPEPLGFVYEDMVTHWGNYAAVKMVERDILKGERIGSKYYFYPETLLKRIDVIQYLLASLGADNSQIDTDNTHIFADSKDYPDYINNAAYLAHKLGIIEGDKRGDALYLNPYADITRVELMKMLDKAMSSKTRSDIELDFIDKHDIPDWGVQYVKNMVGYGIVQGYDDNTIRPLAHVTKAQTVQMMYQMIKYNEQSSVQTLSVRLKNGFYANQTI